MIILLRFTYWFTLKSREKKTIFNLIIGNILLSTILRSIHQICWPFCTYQDFVLAFHYKILQVHFNYFLFNYLFIFAPASFTYNCNQLDFSIIYEVRFILNVSDGIILVYIYFISSVHCLLS
jgi:hypothetical protein